MSKLKITKRGERRAEHSDQPSPMEKKRAEQVRRKAELAILAERVRCAAALLSDAEYQISFGFDELTGEVEDLTLAVSKFATKLHNLSR